MLKKIFYGSLFIIAIALIGYVFNSFLMDHYQLIKKYIVSLGIIAPVYYAIFICIGLSLFVPNQGLSFVGGFVFGFSQGIAINYVGCMAAVILNFYIARYFLSKKLNRKINNYFGKMKVHVGENDWLFAIACRLSPILPNNIINYWLGLTKIKSAIYILTSMVCIIPYIMLYTYFGSISQQILLHQFHPRQQLLVNLFLLLAFILTIYAINKRISWKLSNKPLEI